MIESSKMATIALFVYNRPNHTKLTLDALKLNQYAEKSNLVIFSDGPKSLTDSQEVDSVREIIHSTSGFQSIKMKSLQTVSQ
jgi:dihydrodipicolinate synthase/N-acetylneuraminate lyase